MNSKKITNGMKAVTGLATVQALPGVGFVASLVYDTLAMSDKILYKKCVTFLKSLSDLSANEQQEIMDEFDSLYKTEDLKQEFGERLLEYMNSMNDSYKAMLAAKIFRYWMQDGKNEERRHKKISENDFYHVLEMMNNIPVDVLKAIEDKYSDDNYHIANDKYSLVQYGIYTLKVDTRTINKSLGRSMNMGGSTMPDDLIKQTFYGEVLEAAIWNKKMPHRQENT